MSYSKYFLLFTTCPSKYSTIENDSKYITLVFEKTSLNKLRRMFVHLKSHDMSALCKESEVQPRPSGGFSSALRPPTPSFIRLPYELSSA